MHMVGCTVFISILISIKITSTEVYVIMYQLSTGFTIQTIDACFDTCRNAPYMYVYDTSLLYFYSFSHSHSNGSSMYTTHIYYTHRYLVQPK